MRPAFRVVSLFFALTSIFLAGCNVRSSVPTKQVSLSGVTFVIPESYDIDESAVENGVALFEFEGLPGEIRDGHLAVLGRNYGEVKQGDVVTFHPDGTFNINGKTPESVGVASNTIESDGVLFMIRGEIVNRTDTSGGAVTFEDLAGRSFKAENGSLTINDFTHGPYASGFVVKVSTDGAITFYP
jgi:hypothetical protein